MKRITEARFVVQMAAFGTGCDRLLSELSADEILFNCTRADSTGSAARSESVPFIITCKCQSETRRLPIISARPVNEKFTSHLGFLQKCAQLQIISRLFLCRVPPLRFNPRRVRVRPGMTALIRPQLVSVGK